MSLFEEEEKDCDFDNENFYYSFPAFKAFDRDEAANRITDQKLPPLVLELIPLPYISEDFEQMPVGARGWYASAFLSAMMITSFSNVKAQKNDSARINDDGPNNTEPEVLSGADLLFEDLRRACTAVGYDFPNSSDKNNVFLELGSGTIGLSGMVMAWILAQYRSNFTKSQAPTTNSRNKILLTDYDHNCIEQLERNAVGVRRTFREYFSDTVMKDQCHSQGVIPDIDVARLDWREFDIDQSPVLSEDVAANEDVDAIVHHDSISFACGAALVYMEDTAACVDQVAKILRLHPKCAVWIVQWPRGGWFEVFQQDLLSTRFETEGLKIRIQKFGPRSSPELFSVEVQQLAQKLMPVSMQQEPQMDINYLRAIRITNMI